MAVGDLDNNGRLDAVMTTNDGPAIILRNETNNANHWISLSLVGTRSNRDGLGAKIKITTELGDQYATVTTSSSYQSSSDKRVHFGLGSATTVNRIEILWPSRIAQNLRDIKADQFLTITEAAAQK